MPQLSASPTRQRWPAVPLERVDPLMASDVSRWAESHPGPNETPRERKRHANTNRQSMFRKTGHGLHTGDSSDVMRCVNQQGEVCARPNDTSEPSL